MSRDDARHAKVSDKEIKTSGFNLRQTSLVYNVWVERPNKECLLSPSIVSCTNHLKPFLGLGVETLMGVVTFT